MRFGRRSHDIEPETIDAKIRAERDQLVTLLRRLADRIEHAPGDRIAKSLSGLVAAAEPFVRVVDRALGQKK